MGSSRRDLRRLAALLCAFGICAAPAGAPAARAQEAPPVGLTVGFSADTGEPIAMRVRDVGMVVRVPDGSWRMLCAAALSVSGNSNFFARGLPGGRLVISHYKGLQHGEPGFCDWSYPDPELEDRNVVHVHERGDTLYALSTAGDNSYTLHRSDDGGLTFEVVTDLPPDTAFFTMQVAPSDPQRMYLTAVISDIDAGTSERFMFRTGDGGQTFEMLPFEVEGEGSFKLLGVDPDDPDRVYAAIASSISSHSHGDEVHTNDLVLVSEDGAESWSELLSLAALGGFAVGPGDGELWVGNAEGGLQRSTDRGASFEQVGEEIRVSCLRVQDQRLWICGDSARDPEAFALGYTDDGGESYVGELRFDEVAGVIECGGEPVAACMAPWAGWVFWNNIEDQFPMPGGQDPAPGDGGTPMHDGHDGGAHGDHGGSDGAGDADGGDGCDCRVMGRGDLGGALLIGLALLQLARRRRRM